MSSLAIGVDHFCAPFGQSTIANNIVDAVAEFLCISVEASSETGVLASRCRRQFGTIGFNEVAGHARHSLCPNTNSDANLSLEQKLDPAFLECELKVTQGAIVGDAVAKLEPGNGPLRDFCSEGEFVLAQVQPGPSGTRLVSVKHKVSL